MFLYPQTYLLFSLEKTGSCESDTALRLFAALQLKPSSLPSIWTQKTSLWSRFASCFAFSRFVSQVRLELVLTACVFDSCEDKLSGPSYTDSAVTGLASDREIKPARTARSFF